MNKKLSFFNNAQSMIIGLLKKLHLIIGHFAELKILEPC